MYISAEGKQGKTIIARLKPGYEIVSSIQQVLLKEGIKAGYIPVLQGGFKNLKLDSMTFGGSEDYPQDVELEYRQPLEYFGMGTIAEEEEKPSIHIGNRNLYKLRLRFCYYICIERLTISYQNNPIFKSINTPKTFQNDNY